MGRKRGIPKDEVQTIYTVVQELGGAVTAIKREVVSSCSVTYTIGKPGRDGGDQATADEALERWKKNRHAD